VLDADGIVTTMDIAAVRNTSGAVRACESVAKTEAQFDGGIVCRRPVPRSKVTTEVVGLWCVDLL
jgi:hypothetical protein